MKKFFVDFSFVGPIARLKPHCCAISVLLAADAFLKVNCHISLYRFILLESFVCNSSIVMVSYFYAVLLDGSDKMVDTARYST